MNAERNKQIVLEAYAALNAGDFAGYFARYADDVEFTLFGSHCLSGTFHGKEDIMKNFFPVLAHRLDGFIKVQISNAIAEGDFVVLEARGEARTKDGLAYNNTYCSVFKLQDGKITQVREYMDTDLTKRIFG